MQQVWLLVRTLMVEPDCTCISTAESVGVALAPTVPWDSGRLLILRRRGVDSSGMYIFQARLRPLQTRLRDCLEK